jgi:heme-degrading monooxygenase HmoA
MIARIWNAVADRDRFPSYAQHLENEVISRLRTLDGYEGALLLHRQTGDATELMVVTFWQSRQAITAFAGPNVEQAVVAPRATALLRDYDRSVRHYEIAIRDEE